MKGSILVILVVVVVVLLKQSHLLPSVWFVFVLTRGIQRACALLVLQLPPRSSTPQNFGRQRERTFDAGENLKIMAIGPDVSAIYRIPYRLGDLGLSVGLRQQPTGNFERWLVDSGQRHLVFLWISGQKEPMRVLTVICQN